MFSPHVLLGGGTCEAKIRRAGDAAFPEYSLTGLAAPAGAKASWKASRARRCRFVTGGRMSRTPLSPQREIMDSGYGPPVKPLQQSAARLRDPNRPASRPW